MQAEPPGELRRRVPRSSPTYAVRAPLVAWLRQEAADAARRLPDGYRVLDVGAGATPYRPLFAAAAAEYVAVDAEAARADRYGEAERLPVADASYDVVLCTQVLEHTANPAQAVRELRRAVAPAGRVLVSTHGVQVYHPAPVDLWRWTHEGLERLFRESADWSSLTVTPGAGTAACVGMLVATYVDLLARRGRVAPAGRALVAATNAAAETLDRLAPALREPRPGAILANYHVVAVP